MKPSHYLLLVYAILTACSAAEKKSSQISSQPDEAIEFAKPFTSVCKVGKKGGDGTLIDSNWVLTAAHVAEGMYAQTNGNLVVYFDNGDSSKVKHVFLHPNWQPMQNYDIAL